MASIGFEAVRMSLVDAVERQRAITEQLQEPPEKPQLHDLVVEQSKLLEETLILFNRIT